MANSAPSNDVQSDFTVDGFDFDAEAAFFANLSPGEAEASTGKEKKEAPAQEGATETPAKADKTPEEAASQEAVEAPKDPVEKTTETPEKTPSERRQAADDDEVIVQVGEEARRVSVKDLKRLFGQEASLTQKGQVAAETRKALDAEAHRYSAGLAKMAKEAADRWAEYEKVDYLLAKDAMAPEAFAKLRADALAAHQANEFFRQEASEFTRQAQERQSTAIRQAAEASRKIITDPASPMHIPNWGQETFNEMAQFAISLGAPLDTIRQVTDPWALKVLHMAMAQAKAAKAVKEAPKAQPVVKASPKQNLSSSETPGADKGDKKARTRARLAQTGDVDDAAAAFLAGWETE